MKSHSIYIKWTPRLVKTTFDERCAGVSAAQIAARLGCSATNLRAVWKRNGYSIKEYRNARLDEVAHRVAHGDKLSDIAREQGTTYTNLKHQLAYRGKGDRVAIDWTQYIEQVIEQRLAGMTCVAIAEEIGCSPEHVRQALYRYRQEVGQKIARAWTSEKERAALNLRQVDELSYDDIADRLQVVSGEAVRKKLRTLGYRPNPRNSWTTRRLRRAQVRIQKGASWRQVALDNDVAIHTLRCKLSKAGLTP